MTETVGPIDVVEKFQKLFLPKFENGANKRWPAFMFIAKYLTQNFPHVNVIETGTARLRDNWHGDGQSTILWDYLARETGGFCISIDNNPNAARVARQQVRLAQIVTGDSISWLRGLVSAPSCNLLYLDSFDWSEEIKALSCLHAIGELAAIYGRLPKGCLIAVDDCHDEGRGKHVMVDRFFRYAGVEAVYRGYVSIWAKP